MLWFVGLIWAAFAPLLLLIPAGLLYWALGRSGRVPGRRLRLTGAAALAVLPVAIVWGIDRSRFDSHCATLGRATVFERRPVSGFFLDDATANSFGMRYLHDEGFDWIEARSIYRREGYTRYERAADRTIGQREVDHVTADVVVSSTHSSDAIGSTTRLTITDRASGRVLAQAADAHFNGGRMRWVLGAWGSGACRSRMSSDGSTEFTRFYHLARLTLGRQP